MGLREKLARRLKQKAEWRASQVFPPGDPFTLALEKTCDEDAEAAMSVFADWLESVSFWSAIRSALDSSDLADHIELSRAATTNAQAVAHSDEVARQLDDIVTATLAQSLKGKD